MPRRKNNNRSEELAKPEVPMETIDDFLRTTSFQDYVLEFDVNPADYTTKFIEAVGGDSELNKMRDLTKRSLYKRALKVGGIAVVGYNFTFGTQGDSYSTYRYQFGTAYGMAVIPKQKEDSNQPIGGDD